MGAAVRLALAAGVIAALAGCASTHPRPAPRPAVTYGSLSDQAHVSFQCAVNMPGDVTPGESVTISVRSDVPARGYVVSVTVGGDEGVSGDQVSETVPVGRQVTIPGPHGGTVTVGTFPVTDPGLEDVGSIGGPPCIAVTS